ncbi:MAG: chromosome segregation protein SMC, partial [Candidatus Hydrogenedens sp.]
QQLQEEIERKQKELDRIIEQINKLNPKGEPIEKLKEILDNLIKRKDAILKEIKTLEAKIQKLQSQQQTLQKQITEIQEIIHNNEETYHKLEQKRQKFLFEIENKQSEIKQLSEEIEKVQQNLQKIEQAISQEEVKHQELRENLSRLEARLNSLNELREKYEGFAGGVRAVMNAKHEGILGGEQILGPVGDLIRTERGYELAIESALGGNINNIVVQTAESAKIAITFLKEHWAGRVTFLPLDTLRPGNTNTYPELQQYPGLIGPAIHFVYADKEILPALQYLLYNTYLVQTIDDAIQIAKHHQHYPKLVTMEGEIINQSGAVTGGRTKHEARGLLSRVSEIEELQKQQKKTQQEIQKNRNHSSQLKEQSSSLHQQILHLQNQKNLILNQVQQIQIEHARVIAQQEQVHQLLQQLQGSQTDLSNEIEKIKNEMTKTDEEASLILQDDTQLKSEIQQKQQQLQELRELMEQKRQNLTELKVQFTGVLSQIQEIDNNILRLKNEYNRITSSSDESKQQIQDFLNKIQSLHEKISETRTQLSQFNELRQKAQQELVQVQEQYQQHIQSFEETSRMMKELRQQVQQEQEQLHQLELEFSQIRQQSEFLRQRISEEYQIDLDTISSGEVGADEWDETERNEQIEQIRQQIQRMGTVNPMAVEEYEELLKRYDFLSAQQKDLNQAKEKLQEVIRRIDETVLSMFTQTFRQVGEYFKEFFRRLFNGGHARIYLIDENDPLESGIEIEARPPGKKPQSIHQLSGGEQALTAIALLFAIFQTKPSPFCILDEVDAPLDDTNICRFLEIVKEFSKKSQFIIITHNKQTMACADAIIGITQQERGVSEIVSIKLNELVESTT